MFKIFNIFENRLTDRRTDKVKWCMKVTSHDSKLGVLLSQPNNNYNPNYKTTKTLVWLRLNNGREIVVKLLDSKMEQYEDIQIYLHIISVAAIKSS